jgi:hypothetical protein
MADELEGMNESGNNNIESRRTENLIGERSMAFRFSFSIR